MLANQYAMGSDNYPKLTKECLKLLNNFCPLQHPSVPTCNDEGVAVAQEGSEVKKGERGRSNKVRCGACDGWGGGCGSGGGKGDFHHCGASNHYITNCPELNDNEEAWDIVNVQVDY